MIQKDFANKAVEGRTITIKMTPDFISFHFKREKDREFYWISKRDWNEEFLEHMRHKNWFSDEMADFINHKQVKI